MDGNKNKIFSVILALVFVFLAEVSARFMWGYFEKTTHTGVFAVKKIIGNKYLDAMQTIVPNPYSLYWNNPAFFDETGRQYDDNGYRSRPYVRKENEIKILALGGSTTNGYPYVKDRSKIWTARLEKLVSDFTGRPTHIFNAGLPYGTSAELMTHYLTLGRYLEPDIIIFHEGGNDIVPLMYPGYKTDYSHIRKATPFEARPLERFMLEKSYVLRLIYMVWLRDTGGIYQAEPYPAKLLPREKTLEIVEKNPSEAFRRNVKTIVQEGLSENAKILLVGFLQAREEMLTIKRSDLVGFEKVMVAGVEKHDRIMREIAEQYGQVFLRLDAAKFRDDWFLDNCHLNEEGEAEKALQIFQAMKVMLGEQGARP